MNEEENGCVIGLVAVAEPFITLDYEQVERAKVDAISIDLESRRT